MQWSAQRNVGTWVLAGFVLIVILVSGATALGALPLRFGIAAPVPSGAGPVPAPAPRSGPAPAAPAPWAGSNAPAVTYDGPMPSHLPPSWTHDMPPGAPTVSTVEGSSGYPGVHGVCVGKWPATGQGGYSSSNCIGHDEPAINPYSDLPGSGGNVSWSVDLPVDASPTHNQSDVYIAIWFGMNLFDPEGYDGQCFLELQLYPDTAGSGAPQYNAWSGFAVAWQIQLSNGFEDPCYAAPLNVRGTGMPLQMTGGDHLYVNMSGWQGSPYGENISLVDSTAGLQGSFNLYNHRYHYPLDPAYVANDLQGALPWSPGGDLPVSFAFESGHTIDDPGNDTFGGCNSGVPPPTPLNPSTPCGSYNPRDWAMDTRSPWHFYPVIFHNAHDRATAVQYGFEQDFGASAWIDGLSYGGCTGRDGSNFCSYPWYSYSSSLGAFEFGATDYTGTTQDFGTFHEYDASLQVDSGGLPYYPVKNFSLPTTGGGSLTIIVNGPGSVHFLDRTIGSTTTFDHLLPGAYSISAAASGSDFFHGYGRAGAVHLNAKATGWNGVDLTGTGTLTANFGPAAPSAAPVSFSDVGASSRVTVVPGFTFPLEAFYPSAGPGFGNVPVFDSHAVEVRTGTTAHLLPGIYSIQANPPPGENFTGWSASGGVYLYTPQTNYTWINVSSAGGAIVAHYASTPLHAHVWFAAYPAQGGQIEFGGKLYGSGSVVKVRAGTYDLRAVPAPGYTFVGWSPSFVATMTDFAPTTQILVQYGGDWITAAFRSTATITDGAPGAASGIALNGTYVPSKVHLTQVGNLSYALEAVIPPGMAFLHWSVSPASAAVVANATEPFTLLQVNASATVTPVYGTVTTSSTISIVSAHGTVGFDVLTGVHGSASLHVAPGTYYLSERPSTGYEFTGWAVTGKLSVGTNYTLNTSSFADIENLAGTWTAWYDLVVAGAGTLVAHFLPITHPVSFIDFPYNTHLSITLKGRAGSFTIPAGRTGFVPSGLYRLTLHGGSLAGLAWFSTSNLTVSPPHARSAFVVVDGSGAIYLTGGFWGGPDHTSTAAAPTVPAAGPPSALGGTSPASMLRRP